MFLYERIELSDLEKVPMVKDGIGILSSGRRS